MANLVHLRAGSEDPKIDFGVFVSSYVFASTINEINMLENPNLDTKIACLADLEVKISYYPFRCP